MIPLSIPNLAGNEWQYVKECLDTGWVSSAGKFVDIFEDRLREFTGAGNAVACMNTSPSSQPSTVYITPELKPFYWTLTP